ncbi:MAG: hypothetical protein B6U87_01350 [Candidatus Aenigmarchaeota archaeon ex4484_52]|nr:MAG: hypothetical protein B6U87_01350 [Candidatus Aenigmarchaeota archaeon ex4484_52]
MNIQIIKKMLLEWLSPIIWLFVTIIIYKIYSHYKKNIKKQLLHYAKIFHLKHTKTIIIEVHNYTSFLILIFGAIYILYLSPLPENIILIGMNIIKTIFLIILTKSLANIFEQFIDPLLINITGGKKQSLSKDHAEIVKKSVFLFLWFGCLIFIMQIWKIDITWLVTSTAVLGIVLGLAAQSTLSNVFGGFAICAEKAYQEGDYLRLKDGKIVVVKKIGLKSTWLETYDATTIIIPNSIMSNTELENLNYPINRNIARIIVNTSYDSDVDKVKKTLIEIAKNTKNVLQKPKPKIYLIELGDYALSFKLVCFISDIKFRFKVIESINCRVIKKFKEENIDIPFPTNINHIEFPDSYKYDKISQQ